VADGNGDALTAMTSTGSEPVGETFIEATVAFPRDVGV